MDADLEKRRERARFYTRRWKLANPERAREQQRRYRQKHPKKRLLQYRLANGVPAPTRDEPGVCECCGKPETARTRKRDLMGLSIDHCHDTHSFRGWLCKKCNTGIGMLGDGIAGLEKAIEYLRRVSVK